MNVLEVLNDRVAQELLASAQLARLAYTWTDGISRCGPHLVSVDGFRGGDGVASQAKSGTQAEGYFVAP